VGALLVLQRSPVVFFRDRSADLIGGPIIGPWQDDPLIRAVFFLVEVTIAVVAIGALGPPSLRKHWALVAFLAVVVVSTLWSVERDATGPRALMFVGTAIVGWYIGSRFEIGQQIVFVAAASGIGALACLAGLVLWPDLARSTAGVPGRWSGIYVNRNHLGIVMTMGLLALAFLAVRYRGYRLAAVVGLAALEGYLCLRSGSRTGPVALAGVLGVTAFMVIIRWLRRFGVSLRTGAGLTTGTTILTWSVIHHHWATITEWLGRNYTLNRRTSIWALDRLFISQRPWQGWGFEAVWAHRPTAELAVAAFHAPFGDAHNGYYEILLGVGRAGFVFFLVFLVITAWRTFSLAWDTAWPDGLWPLACFAFVVISNFSESFFVTNEALWGILVAASISAAKPSPHRLA
jgi:O-antigen ligase